ncbi:MAG: phosphoribosyltransferase family protein [Patescibacteria group bacterium]|jgi:competence protein ComFC
MIPFSQYLNNFLDYIFPQFCLGCKQEGNIFCDSCLNKLELLPDNQKPWPEENFLFDECHICLDYHDPVVKKLIKKYKYGYFDNLANPIAAVYIKKINNLNLNNAFIICNVPLHKRKKKKRGFDQTELIAKKISANTQIPYFDLLNRQRFTKAQAELDKEQRQKNMSQAFVINKKINSLELINHPVLLIDDIATTGTTLNEASRALQQAGFKQIICLALAKN